MRNLRLTEIWVYPVKSLGGIRLVSSKILPKGLPFDRRWMLVDNDGIFLTQRIYPKMALFRLSIENSDVVVEYEKSRLTISAPPSGSKAIMATIWDDQVEVVEADKASHRWFSERLGISCRLVYFPEQNARPVDQRFAINADHVSLADGFPFLIIGQQSLNDLNSRLPEPLSMNRFRPNFVFSGGLPYEEDGWKKFMIGKNRFAGVKPCARCTVITVSQETAERGKEPLAMLSTYRRIDNKVFFGQNLIALDYDEIFEGDEIVLD